MADHGGETTVIDEDLIRISCEEERAHAKKPQAPGDAEVVPTPLTLPEIMRDVTQKAGRPGRPLAAPFAIIVFSHESTGYVYTMSSLQLNDGR